MIGVKRNLNIIDERGTAPINLIQYKRLGLIKVVHPTTKTGKKGPIKLQITQKGRKVMGAYI